jgi:SAM-dependent methyltransferase
MNLPDSSILTNIQFQGNTKPVNLLFEKKYITVRCIENRLYSDEEVEKLPHIDTGHSHFEEWKVRQRSSRSLLRYLSAKKRRQHILEVGCGNGWLSHSLAGIPGAKVTGLDINFTELQQAARVFNDDPHLKFIYGDIYTGVPGELKFDIILFAASIQYFQSVRKVLVQCLKQLAPGGEIHLLDSHFYKPDEIAQAKKRTVDYYGSLGYPEMADYYFHHGIRELQAFNHTLMYNPGSAINRILGKSNRFHWIRITK